MEMVSLKPRVLCLLGLDLGNSSQEYKTTKPFVLSNAVFLNICETPAR